MVAKFYIWVSGILTLDVVRTSSENTWLESPQAVENLSFRTSAFLSRHHFTLTLGILFTKEFGYINSPGFQWELGYIRLR